MQPAGQSNGAIFEKLKFVLSENKSLSERLDIANATINSRNREIEVLQQMLSDANAMRSQVEHKMNELEHLQKQLDEMRRLVSP